jgi:glycosyltransferase involved in cell wall biosynthesis
MMRLFFDMSAMPDVGRAVTGISRVVVSLLVELLRMEPARCEVFGISFRQEEMDEHPSGRLWTLGEITACAGQILRVDGISAERLRSTPGALRSGDVIVCLGEQWLFPNTLESLSRLKKNHGVKVVTLVHDLVPFFMQELYWPGFPEDYCTRVTGLVALSDVVLVYSESTRRDLLHWIPEAANKPLARLHLGTELSESQSERPEGIAEQPFILYVSTIQPRKNHALLLPVWRLLLARRGANCPRLVLVGKKGWNSDDLMYFFEHNPELSEAITILEQPTDKELCWLYQNSWLTIYPSLYEGWGLPIAESLAAGKLCLTSNSSSMPEVGRDLVEYFSPHDAMGLCKLIEKYMDDPAALLSAEKRIRTQFEPNSWRECALELLLAASGSIGS